MFLTYLTRTQFVLNASRSGLYDFPNNTRRNHTSRLLLVAPSLPGSQSQWLFCSSSLSESESSRRPHDQSIVILMVGWFGSSAQHTHLTLSSKDEDARRLFESIEVRIQNYELLLLSCDIVPDIRTTTLCTSATQATGPSGCPRTVLDSTVLWKFREAQAKSIALLRISVSLNKNFNKSRVPARWNPQSAWLSLVRRTYPIGLHFRKGIPRIAYPHSSATDS